VLPRLLLRAILLDPLELGLLVQVGLAVPTTLAWRAPAARRRRAAWGARGQEDVIRRRGAGLPIRHRPRMEHFAIAVRVTMHEGQRALCALSADQKFVATCKKKQKQKKQKKNM
jgi:hypothetical protein